MADILVRGLDDRDALRLKEKAKQAGRSLNEFARDALVEAARPSREQVFKEIEALRREMGPMPDDSTDLIREDRDR